MSMAGTSNFRAKLNWLKVDKPHNHHQSNFRGLSTRILDNIDVDDRSPSNILQTLPRMFSNSPLILNAINAAWLIGSVLSLSIPKLLNLPADNSDDDISDLDRLRIDSWARYPFELMAPIRKISGTMAPVLRLCQFVERVLYPEDDDGEAWGKLVKSWWNDIR